MDVESRKTFRFGFVLRESDLRRLVDTVNDQFQKLPGDGETSRRFRVTFRNGVVADNLTLEEVFGQENSGHGRIVRLMYAHKRVLSDDNPVDVSFEFINVQDDEPGEVSVRFHVFGHERDWVFVTSSLLEERIERVRRWNIAQLSTSRTRIYTRLLALPVMFVAVVATVIFALVYVTPSGPTKFETELHNMEARWRSGQLKDPVYTVLAVERLRLDNCERLIDFARQREISLVVPAFALVEARLAWQNVVRRRNRLNADVHTELAELARSRPLVSIAEQSQAFVTALVGTAQHDRSRLEVAIASLINHASIVVADSETVKDAFEVEQRLGLSAQDSLIYGSILRHLTTMGAGTKIFATQNTRDFAIPTIQEELASYSCKLITAFDGAEAFVRSQIAG